MEMFSKRVFSVLDTMKSVKCLPHINVFRIYIKENSLTLGSVLFCSTRIAVWMTHKAYGHSLHDTYLFNAYLTENATWVIRRKRSVSPHDKSDTTWCDKSDITELGFEYNANSLLVVVLHHSLPLTFTWGGHFWTTGRELSVRKDVSLPLEQSPLSHIYVR